jgi:hypothetical protein
MQSSRVCRGCVGFVICLLPALGSVPRGVGVALAQDSFDDTAQTPHGIATPVHGDSGVLDAIERWHPVLVEPALFGEVGRAVARLALDAGAFDSELCSALSV